MKNIGNNKIKEVEVKCFARPEEYLVPNGNEIFEKMRPYLEIELQKKLESYVKVHGILLEKGDYVRIKEIKIGEDLFDAVVSVSGSTDLIFDKKSNLPILSYYLHCSDLWTFDPITKERISVI